MIDRTVAGFGRFSVMTIEGSKQLLYAETIRKATRLTA